MRYADMSCGAVTTCTVCQPAVTQGLAAVNGVLDGIADEVTAIATALKKISGFLVEVSSFVLSTGWQKFSNFLSGLDKLLAPFYNLLTEDLRHRPGAHDQGSARRCLASGSASSTGPWSRRSSASASSRSSTAST